MNRIKTLALALGAVFALGALTAASAFATPEFTASAGGVHTSVNITGTQNGNQVFDITENSIGNVTCAVAKYAGSDADGTGSTVEVTPTYENCTAFGTLKATVTTNGCEMEFHAETNLGGGEWSGSADIQGCNNATEGIQVHIFNESGGLKCTIDVEEQNGIGPITFRNNANGTIDVNTEMINNVKADATQGFLGCGTTSGTHNGGSLSGSATVSAKTTGGGAATVVVTGS